MELKAADDWSRYEYQPTLFGSNWALGTPGTAVAEGVMPPATVVRRAAAPATRVVMRRALRLLYMVGSFTGVSIVGHM